MVNREGSTAKSSSASQKSVATGTCQNNGRPVSAYSVIATLSNGKIITGRNAEIVVEGLMVHCETQTTDIMTFMKDVSCKMFLNGGHKVSTDSPEIFLVDLQRSGYLKLEQMN